MTDMPNFWWCPTHHLYRGGAERPCADAVKLGDIEALRAEIRAVLDRQGSGTPIDSVIQRLRDIRTIVDREPAREELQPSSEWRCARCGSDRWLGWRAGPEHEGYPRKAQCTPCGYVQDLPTGGSETGGNAPEETSRG